MKSCIIYEGVFDPPHINHFWILQHSKEILCADAIIMVSNNKAAYELSNKPNASKLEKRLTWCRLAFKDVASVMTSDKTFTVDIISNLLKHNTYDKWYYLIGPDKNIEEYKDYDKINSMVEVLKINTIDIRSTSIRQRIRNNQRIDGMLAPNLTIKDIQDVYVN